MADLLALTHACTTAADALVNYRRYVPQRPAISHRPDGNMADMPKSTLIFRFWIDIWFYQGYVRASHACKLPIAPMGDSHFARCLQGGGVFVDGGGSVTFDSCNITGNTAPYVRARAQNFPSP